MEPLKQLDPMFYQILNLGLNVTALILIMRLTRSYARVELKVDTIWEWFVNRNEKS